MSDARSVLSIAISHNMDNINPIDQAALAKYMGLTKDKTGNTGTECDASGSKIMTTADGKTITYGYRRGGVELIANINVPSQEITWTVYGIDRTNNANRITALREGLKLAQDSDLTDAAASAFT